MSTPVGGRKHYPSSQKPMRNIADRTNHLEPIIEKIGGTTVQTTKKHTYQQLTEVPSHIQELFAKNKPTLPPTR